jgi:hypothetical protein
VTYSDDKEYEGKIEYIDIPHVQDSGNYIINKNGNRILLPDLRRY